MGTRIEKALAGLTSDQLCDMHAAFEELGDYGAILRAVRRAADDRASDMISALEQIAALGPDVEAAFKRLFAAFEETAKVFRAAGCTVEPPDLDGISVATGIFEGHTNEARERNRRISRLFDKGKK
jgi:hypothetical protein